MRTVYLAATAGTSLTAVLRFPLPHKERLVVGQCGPCRSVYAKSWFRQPRPASAMTLSPFRARRYQARLNCSIRTRIDRSQPSLPSSRLGRCRLGIEQQGKELSAHLVPARDYGNALEQWFTGSRHDAIT